MYIYFLSSIYIQMISCSFHQFDIWIIGVIVLSWYVRCNLFDRILITFFFLFTFNSLLNEWSSFCLSWIMTICECLRNEKLNWLKEKIVKELVCRLFELTVTLITLYVSVHSVCYGILILYGIWVKIRIYCIV